MTDRWSCGYCVRISVSSATATFFAARKQPRSSIERLMSTSSTVDGPGQLLGPVDLEVVGRAGGPPVAAARAAQPARSPRAPSALASVPRRSRWNGSPNSYGLVVSSRSPPRPARSIRWPPNASRSQPREQVVEDLLADPAAAARRQLEALAVARQVAGLLEPAGEVVERVEVADRVVAEQLADLVAVDRREVAGDSTSASASSSRPSPGAARSARARLERRAPPRR